MQDTVIKSLMTTAVKCASPSTPLVQVVQTMIEDRHSCMVIAENNIPVGIITERDIVKQFAELMQKTQRQDTTAASIMTSPAITVNEECSLFEALLIAQSNQIRHLPVTQSEGKLVGLITQTDLVAAQFQIVKTQKEILERAVAERTRELMGVNKKLQELSLEDPLLKIGNRRAMEIDLEHTHATARRYQRPYAVILLDADHFKLYNDYYGHVAGDEALKQVATFLKNNIRESDRIYRYGGEEILILLPETLPDGAQALGQRILDGLVKQSIPHETEPLKVLTLSGGISGPDAAAVDEPWYEVIQRADCALFAAKTGGRNRIFSLYLTDFVTHSDPAAVPL
jgi:diguanylate cyclase (GGDEF)-like protein